jgi:hypothetical protein
VSAERRYILELLADGKITVLQAAHLLDALEAPSGSGSARGGPGRGRGRAGIVKTVKKYAITFRQADSPITAPVTKFGGRPVWLSVPQWPLSRALGEPMRFLGQVAIDRALFPNSRARMAYLFMTDFSDEEQITATWEPDSGENAVVLQPGEYRGPWVPRREGPTLYRMIEGWPREPVPCEFGVALRPGEDPDLDVRASADAGHPLPPEALEGNKIGGVPWFLQYPEYPRGGPWRLLLQLDSARVPFEVNFGDAGVGYAFLSEDGTAAKFLWQGV